MTAEMLVCDMLAASLAKPLTTVLWMHEALKGFSVAGDVYNISIQHKLHIGIADEHVRKKNILMQKQDRRVLLSGNQSNFLHGHDSIQKL